MLRYKIKKRKMMRIIFCCLFIIGFIIQPIKTYSSDKKTEYGLNANFSISINQYFNKPKTGLAPSFGLYYILCPEKNNFGLYTSINYEKYNFIIRNIDNNLYESHYNFDYDDIIINYSAARKIHENSLCLDFGLFVKYIFSQPNIVIITSNKLTGKRTFIDNKNEDITTVINKKIYQGISIGLSKNFKRIGFQVRISEMLHSPMHVKSIIGADKEVLEFKILPLEIFAGVRYNISKRIKKV